MVGLHDSRRLRDRADRAQSLGFSQAPDPLRREARQRYAALRRWLRRLFALTVKELKQCSRDLMLMAFMAYAFVAAVFISGTGVTQDLRNATVAVHDADASRASRDLIYRFRLPYFRVNGTFTGAADGLRVLDEGSSMLLLDIPADFSETLTRGAKPAVAQLMIDTSNVTMGYLGSAYAGQILGGMSEEWSRKSAARNGLDTHTIPSVESVSRIWYNPNLDGHWFNAIGQWLTMMTVMAMLLPATALVRERERGTIEQLLVAPVSPVQIMASKAISMTLMSLLGTALSVYLVMRLLIGVPFAGGAGLFFGTTALYVLAIAGLGLAIGTFARSSAEVGMLVILISVPMTALSGTWTAPEAMPRWSRYALQVSPLYHFIECGYGILLRGATLSQLWVSILAIAALGFLAFFLAWLRLRAR